MKAIATALLKAQSEMSNPTKGSSNPYFNSKYADLNAVREAVIPTLNSNGIIVLQPMITVEGKNYVKTVLLHESGEAIESLTEIMYNKQNDAQAQGSGITYARRYGLQSLVCVGAYDDDGNMASEPTKKQSNPVKRIESEVDKAIKEAKKAKDVQSLEVIWKEHKNLWTDSDFKNEVIKLKTKFTHVA